MHRGGGGTPARASSDTRPAAPRRGGRSRLWSLGAVLGAGVVVLPMSPRRDLLAAGPDTRAPSCDPVSGRDIIDPLVRLDSGEYALTVAASSGPSAGAWVKGRLWLRRAAAFDTSSIAADRELAAEADREPLYGAVIIDFGGVGTPVLAGGGRAPDPRSFDPHRPGVLVVRRADTTGGDVAWRILVATTANDRRVPCEPGAACPALPSDGPGVVMTVENLTPDSFAGEWRPAAPGASERGYFCAARVRYYPYTVRRHIP